MFRPGLDRLEARKVLSLAPVPANAPFPFTAIVQIVATFPNGEVDTGSGVMVDSYHVLTAGHMVYQYHDGGFATSIVATPEMSGPGQPFGQASATIERTPLEWQYFSRTHSGELVGNDSFDYGLITLNWPIGNETHWMSFGYDNNGHTFAPGTRFETAGYPATNGYSGRRLYDSAGPINGLSRSGNAILYLQKNITIWAGQSGSPVWSTSNGVIDGIQSGGGLGSPTSENDATRITQRVFETLQTWISTDTPPPMPTSAPIPTPPEVMVIGPTSQTRMGIRSIQVQFSEPLSPRWASHPHLYDVLAIQTRFVNRQKITIYERLPIRKIVTNGHAGTVRIELARPYRGEVEMIVHPGIVAADGGVSRMSYAGILH